MLFFPENKSILFVSDVGKIGACFREYITYENTIHQISRGKKKKKRVLRGKRNQKISFKENNSGAV